MLQNKNSLNIPCATSGGSFQTEGLWILSVGSAVNFDLKACLMTFQWLLWREYLLEMMSAYIISLPNCSQQRENLLVPLHPDPPWKHDFCLSLEGSIWFYLMVFKVHPEGQTTDWKILSLFPQQRTFLILHSWIWNISCQIPHWQRNSSCSWLFFSSNNKHA